MVNEWTRTRYRLECFRAVVGDGNPYGMSDDSWKRVLTRAAALYEAITGEPWETSLPNRETVTDGAGNVIRTYATGPQDAPWQPPREDNR